MSPENDKAAALGGNAFNPKVVFGLLLFGALAFFATLYFIGTGNTGADLNNGSAHANGKGLHGYAALAALLEEDGHEVTLSRNQANLDDEGLLILTPPQNADPEDIDKIVLDRAYVGPTLIILPKWIAYQMPSLPGGKTEEGWVQLAGIAAPDWPSKLAGELPIEIEHADTEGGFDPAKTTQKHQASWTGLGAGGTLPSSSNLFTNAPRLIPLILDGENAALAGYIEDYGYYPELAAEAGVDPGNPDDFDGEKWPVVFVIEPDLVNNYGFSDKNTAQNAHILIDLISQNGEVPVIFDMTLNGLGAQQSLLALAVTPPFLAATLCLILAMIVVALRAFRRFGPPVAQGRAIAFGKARLVRNSAGFIQRSKRLHLLSGPYADMIRERVSKILGLRHSDENAIDAALSRRAPDAPSFAECAHRLRNARSPQELLRAADALKSIERMLTK